MKAAWVVVALGASACSDPAIEMSLAMPATQPVGFNLSCVTAVEVNAVGNEVGSQDVAPDVVGKCVDLVAPLTKWGDIRTQIAGKFDLALPSSGLAGVEIRGVIGSCQDKFSEREAIFYGGAAYSAGDTLRIPLVPNISCDKQMTYTVHAVDLMNLVTNHTCAVPTDSQPLIFAGNIRPRMLGDLYGRMVFEDGASAATPTTAGTAVIDSYSTTAPKACIAMGYGSPGNLAGSCVNAAATTLCANAGEIELPVIPSVYAGLSIESDLAGQYGEPVFGAVFEASAAATTTKLALTNATVTLEDPTQGAIRYVSRSSNKLQTIPNATSTGADGMFMAYLKGEPTAIIVKAPGHRDQRLIIGSSGQLPATVLAVLPTQ